MDINTIPVVADPISVSKPSMCVFAFSPLSPFSLRSPFSSGRHPSFSQCYTTLSGKPMRSGRVLTAGCCRRRLAARRTPWAARRPPGGVTGVASVRTSRRASAQQIYYQYNPQRVRRIHCWAKTGRRYTSVDNPVAGAFPAPFSNIEDSWAQGRHVVDGASIPRL